MPPWAWASLLAQWLGSLALAVVRARPATRRSENSSAIADDFDGDERSIGLGPERMDQPGEERLARSGLADDQDRSPGRGDRRRQLDDLSPARISADQADLASEQLERAAARARAVAGGSPPLLPR